MTYFVLMNYIKRTLVLFLFTFLYLNGFGQSDFTEMRQLLSNSKWSAVLPKVDQYLKKNPDSDTAMLIKAEAYWGLGKGQEAYMNVSSVIEKNPKFADAYYLRGSLLVTAGQPVQGKNDLAMAMKYMTNDSLRKHILLTRSSANLATMNYQASIDDCKAGLLLDSVGHGFFSNLAMAYNEMGLPDSALPWLYRSYALDSTLFYTVMNIGFVLSSKKDYAGSMEWFDKAIKLDPDAAYSYSNRAYAKLKLGKPSDALTDVNKSISLDKTNSYAFRNRALIYLEMGKKDKACDDLKKAIELGFREQYGKEVDELLKENCQ
jgi:tetratricopeptide (TPR) repeat protein